MGNRFIPGQEQQTWAERFRPEITEESLRNDYARYQNMLREEARRIQDSSEARKAIVKGLHTEDPRKLLGIACRCIYDLTGDTVFRDKVLKELEEMNEGMGKGF